MLLQTTSKLRLCMGKTSTPNMSSFVECIGREGYDITLARRLLLFLSPGAARDKHAKVPRILLVHGPRGCGKTALLQRTLTATKESEGIIVVNIPAAKSTGSSYNEFGFSSILSALPESESSGVCIVIDGAEDYFPQERISDSVDSLRLLEFLNFCARVNKLAPTTRVVIIALARDPTMLHSLFYNHMDDIVFMDAPDAERRLLIWTFFLGRFPADSKDSLVEAAAELNMRANGFCGADIEAIYSGALRLATLRGDSMCADDLRASFEEHTDRKLADVDGSSSSWDFIPAGTTGVQWKDIGGLEEVKLALNEMVVWPTKYAPLYARMGAQAPLGIVMHGPPGTGKTLLAKALAMESNANFLTVSIGNLIRGEIGESEKELSCLFRAARRCAPCVIFFDEFQAMFGERGESGSVCKTLVSQMLHETDALSNDTARNPSGRVVLVAATNCIEAVDPALLRAGRFDRSVYVPLPDRESRRRIAELQRQRMRIPWNDRSSKILEYISSASEGMTGAELVSVCNHAGLDTFANTKRGCVGDLTLEDNDFRSAIQRMQSFN